MFRNFLEFRIFFYKFDAENKVHRFILAVNFRVTCLFGSTVQEPFSRRLPSVGVIYASPVLVPATACQGHLGCVTACHGRRYVEGCAGCCRGLRTARAAQAVPSAVLWPNLRHRDRWSGAQTQRQLWYSVFIIPCGPPALSLLRH